MDLSLSLLELERRDHPHLSDRVLVERIAARVISDLGITEPPVDMEMVASFCDIAKIEYATNLDVPGCLIPGATHHRVRISASDIPTRQRFTIGHECGHTFLPGFSQQLQYRCSPRMTGLQDIDEEALSDAAASSLLLPLALVRPRINDVGFGFEAVYSLAEVFQASIIATASKIASASLEPAALLTFDVRQKPSEAGTNAAPKLRLRRVVPHGRGWPYFLPHKSAEPGGPIDRALAGEPVYEPMITLKGLTTMPLTCEVHAELIPMSAVDQRVVVLLRQL